MDPETLDYSLAIRVVREAGEGKGQLWLIPRLEDGVLTAVFRLSERENGDLVLSYYWRQESEMPERLFRLAGFTSAGKPLYCVENAAGSIEYVIDGKIYLAAVTLSAFGKKPPEVLPPADSVTLAIPFR